MTDEQIIKAMVCCYSNSVEHCDDCPFRDDDIWCDNLESEAVKVLNRQKEENDELKRIVGLMNNRHYYRKFVDEVFRKQKGKELTDPDFDYIYQLYFEQKAEIERLTKENDVLKTNCNSMCVSMPNMAKAERAEVIKEFTKLVNRRLNSNTPRGAYLYNIMKEVEKEMTEGKK